MYTRWTLASALLCDCELLAKVVLFFGKLAATMQVIQTLQVEDKVSQCHPVNKFEGALVLPLFLRRAKLTHDLDYLSLVEEEIKLEVLSSNFNLESLEGAQGELPLRLFENDIRAGLVKISFNVDHEPVGKDNEPSLVHKERVSLDDESMALVAVVLGQLAVRLEKVLPKDGQLPLDEIQYAELHRPHARSLLHRAGHE